MTAQQRAGLTERAVHDINQLDPEVHLSPSQKRYVSCVQRDENVIDYNAVKEFQESLSHPIHFFDFETDGSPTPHISGVRPYQQVPFQYSCHVLGAEASLTHVDYLHEKTSDPRPDLISALRRDVADHGTIVVYNAQFERKVLLELAALFPNDAPFLQSMARRLRDQLDVFREHYASPAFRGSNSLKRVLAVIHPEADYHDLAVRRGDDAQAVWIEMIHTDAGPEKRQMSEDLRAYCQRDTYAMVLIHNHLSELVASSVS